MTTLTPGLRHSRSSARFRLAGALLVAFAGAVGLAAQAPAGPAKPDAAQQQQQPQQQPPTPTFRTEANFVRVDVYPSAGGRQVPDLRADDFEVFEDGKPQKIETFEHIVVRAPLAQAERVEPNTVRESNQMATDARARLFVLFLDTYHVTVDGAVNVKQPLARLLNRIIGPDDMVAVMTPETSAGSLTFARRTTTIEAMLDQWWKWGRRDRITDRDPLDEQYERCFPPSDAERASGRVNSALAEALIDRRHEKMALDASEDLVVHLRGLREERKAVLLISEGWKLYRPDERLARSDASGGRVPGPPGIGTDPTGRLRMEGDGRNYPGEISTHECDRDRMRLSMEDDTRQFRDLMDEANRANVSFYPIDPRGLPVFDTSIGPNPPLPPSVDQAQLNARIDTLRTLALNTDGLAVVNSNNIEGNLKRIVDDLTSYDLLGYYSTGKLDGKFHSISVRVKRPGVDVRARRGYRAPTEEEVRASTAVAAAKIDPAVAAMNRAVGMLGAIRPQAPMRFRAGYGPAMVAAGGAGQGAAIWIAGELDPSRSLTKDWEQGATAAIAVADASGESVATTQAKLAPGARALLVRVPADRALPSGDYIVRIEARPPDGTPASEVLRVSVPAAMTCGEPLLYRRSPYGGLGWQPVGDLRFRRQDRLRVEVPVAGSAGTPAVRLLGRTGVPIPLPIAVTDSPVEGAGAQAGPRSIVGEFALAPLAAADYVLEISFTVNGQPQKLFTAFRIVP